jgi:hypothetical protein
MPLGNFRVMGNILFPLEHLGIWQGNVNQFNESSTYYNGLVT